MKKRFEGKVALVTGGTSGIGEAIANRLAEEGAKVAVSARNETKTKHFLVLGDVSSFSDSKEVIAKVIKKFGKLDILVNNAGIYPQVKFKDMTEQQWDQVLDVNLKGQFNCAKASFPYLVKSKGKIVNIASIAGTTLGYANLVHYSASKAGVLGFTKALAVELAKDGVNVNAIAPGIIATPGTKGLNIKEEEKLVPKGRVGKPEDIANAAAFLASDDADYVTGQLLVVDGGMVLD